MARIELAPQVTDDVARILAHFDESGAGDSPGRITEIIAGADALVHNPLIGRSVEDGMRELVIGRDERGHLALYRYIDALDLIFVLVLRSQREAGYSGP